MQSLMDFWVQCFGSWISFLGSLQIVSGVSLLAFCAALIIIAVMINSFLLRGR
jgi:hypothetical protein